MRMRPHPPAQSPSGIPSSDRFSSQHQAYLQQHPRILSSTPYIHHRGNEPVHPSDYLQNLSPPGVSTQHHHPHPPQMMSLPANYPRNRPTQTSTSASGQYNPLVLPLPGQMQQQNLFSQSSRSLISLNNSVTHHHHHHSHSTLIQSQQPQHIQQLLQNRQSQVPQYQNIAQSSKGSVGKTFTQTFGDTTMNKINPDVVSSAVSREKLSNEDLAKPAMMDPSPTAPINKELEILTQGLKLQQQEWGEKPEIKKLYTEMAQLLKILHMFRLSKTPTSENLNFLYNLLIHKLPQTLDRVQLRTKTSLESLIVIFKDIQNYSDEITEQLQINEKICTFDLVETECFLKRAKRRRRNQEEYEKLASEIMTKKSRDVCEKELKIECAKIEETKKEIKRWKQLMDIRKLQTETALTYIRNLVDSFHNASNIFSIIDEFEREEKNIENSIEEMKDDKNVELTGSNVSMKNENNVRTEKILVTE